ncbi:YutD family protein [Macrococcus sp. EM39E]|uniref:YutD family protein n=1 Tax=Macrococcus animalis TaxID=3395467 RepID=UPI0039BF4255
MIIQLNQHYFHLLENYNNAFDQEMFEGRYSEILDRYPYIVGDIGFEQLRLKGFFEDKKKGADISRRFSAIQDYLLEYCNFGCPFFILKRLTESEVVKLTQPEDITNIETNQEAMVLDMPVSEEIINVKTAVEVKEENEELDSTDSNLKDASINNMKTLSDFLK